MDPHDFIYVKRTVWEKVQRRLKWSLRFSYGALGLAALNIAFLVWRFYVS